MPANDDARKQRRHERLPIALLVQYRFNTFEDFTAEYAVDISPGGMFIHTTETVEPGALVHLQFSLKDGSKLVEATGRVAHVQRPPAGTPGLGVEFVDCDAEALALIQRVYEEQAHAKRAGG